MLAAASLGAVFSSCSPDFGTLGVLDRFGQIEPVVLVAADGYHYNGAAIDCLAAAGEIQAGLPSLRATVVVPARSDRRRAPTSAGPPDGAVAWDDLLDRHRDRAALRFRALPFDHPWYVLYSSGTTGPPKCIVHRAGGVLLMHLKEHQLHCDIHRGDRVLYYTTTGWMMWNWLASALASGATIVLYDGSPFVPDADRLFDLVDEEGDQPPRRLGQAHRRPGQGRPRAGRAPTGCTACARSAPPAHRCPPRASATSTST